MESNPEGQKGNIVFKNQPKLSEHEVDRAFNEKRLSLVPLLKEFFATDEMFKGKEVSVEFSHEGVSSLVCFIEVEDQKLVLKIPLDDGQVKDEATFLKTWESVGVSVPHVHKEGKISNAAYLIMDFIDAPLLTDAIKAGDIKKDIGVDEGKILAQMHTPQIEGYGRMKDGVPEYKEFKEWVLSEGMKKRYKAVQDNNLLSDEHGALEKVLDILIAYTEKDKSSTYCHFDFGSDNILASQPLTVIDPDPMFNHWIIDIGRSILLANSGGHTGDDLKKGYFSNDKPYDKQALQASIILNAYYKFPYWHKKNKTNQIKRVQKYLSQTKHLLG